MEKAVTLAAKAKESIERFVDTAKLKGHLAAMDAEDLWDDFEEQFRQISKRFEKFIDSVRTEKDESILQGHLALMEVKERWDVVEGEVERVVDHISNSVEEKFDRAEVKMSLAKLETRDLVDSLHVKERLEKLGDNVKEEWYSLLSKIDDRVVEFINRFPLK